VRAPVSYLAPPNYPEPLAAHDFWFTLRGASDVLPELWQLLPEAREERARHVYQALLVAMQARANGLSHLHAHFASSATTVARLAARFAGLTYTFTCHAKDIFHQSVRAEDLRRKLSDAAAAVTVSDYNVDYMRRMCGPAADRLRRIYNGLDLRDFPYHEPAERPARVLAVGRLVEKKGFADLLEACAILARLGREFDCWIVGSGELEADLKQRIERLALGERVALLGARPRREIVRLVHEAAVLAVPCVVGQDGNRDGLPTVLLEAMALGTPCVSTDVTGIPEVLRDGETGLMVPQHDPAALAAAIERLLSDPALRVALATRARRQVEQYFDIHRNTVTLREMFRTAAAGREATLQEAAR
jgi:glycosyltransferase involved in cell wall biosynthesis